MLEEEDEPLDTADWLSRRMDGTHGAKHKRNTKP